MKQTVTMPGYMGKPWEVTGEIQAGLILHKMGPSWVLTHIGTGCLVGKSAKLQKDVKATRAALFEVLPDWTAPDMAGLAKAAGFKDAADFARKIRDVAY